MSIINLNRNNVDPLIVSAVETAQATAYHFGIREVKKIGASSYATEEMPYGIGVINPDSNEVNNNKNIAGKPYSATERSIFTGSPLFTSMTFLGYEFVDKNSNIVKRAFDLSKNTNKSLVIESCFIDVNIRKNINVTTTIAGTKHQQIMEDPDYTYRVRGTITNNNIDNYEQYPYAEVKFLSDIAADDCITPIDIPFYNDLYTNRNSLGGYFFIQNFELQSTDYLNVQPFTMDLIIANLVE